MHRRSTVPSTLEEARPGSEGGRDSGLARESGPGPGSGSDDSGGDSDDPFIIEGGGKGKNRDGREPEPLPQGFWLIKRKEWKTCYNPTGECGLNYDSWDRQEE